MIMKAPSNDIMNKIQRGVLASYSYDSAPEDRSVSNNMRQCIELISRFSTLAAYGYQAKRRYYDEKSMYIHNPLPNLSTAENFLHLIRADMQYTKLEADTLDLALILHAEHGGGNNSSLTVHVVSSADTDTYSAIAAAVGSLKGRRHGGANIRVVEMMDEIKANIFIKLQKAKLLTEPDLSTGWDMPYTQSAIREQFCCATKRKNLQKKKGCSMNSICTGLSKIALRKSLSVYMNRQKGFVRMSIFIRDSYIRCSIFRVNFLRLFSQFQGLQAGLHTELKK